MKKPLTIIVAVTFICLSFLSVGTISKATQVSQPGNGPEEYVPNEVIVKFNEDVVGDLSQNKWLIQNAVDATQGTIKTYLGQEVSSVNWDPSVLSHRSFIGDSYLFHIRVAESIGVDEAISFFKSIPYVKYAEKNYVRYPLTTSPNDLDLTWDETHQVKRQWALYNADNDRCDIHAPEAWDIFTGSSDIVVAVIDTGIDLSHDDLAANIWTNPNDPSGGGDNDLNGFEDDVHGWNFLSNYLGHDVGDNNVQDLNGHGTRMSGAIGAVGNNQLGMTGVCWNVKIMTLRYNAGNDSFIGISEIVNAIDYATSNGASVINASFGSNNFSQAEEDAINRARGKNVLFIAAAGNDGNDTDDYPVYPADYPLENIISVLSTDPTDHKGYWSCYGDESVDLGAPGEPIWSTELDNSYGFASGTSEAAAHVTGVAALALGMCPGLTASRLRSLIIDNTDDISYLHGYCASGGRLNAYKVLNALSGSTPPTAPTTLSAYPTSWNTIQIAWNDNSNDELGFEIQRKSQYQSSFIRRNCSDLNSTSHVSIQDTPIDLAQGTTYTYRVRATNRAGMSSFTNEASTSIPYTLPAAPSDLEALSAIYPNVNLEWANNANDALTVSLERRKQGSGGWSVRATLGPNATSYTDSGVQVGSTYDYRVRTWNPVGYSSYSNVITVEIENW